MRRARDRVQQQPRVGVLRAVQHLRRRAPFHDAPGLHDRLREQGLLVGNLRPGWLRAVTYRGISDDAADAAADILAGERVAA